MSRGHRTTADQTVLAAFQAAQQDPMLVILEGLHALKHALRFGATIELACCRDVAELRELAAGLCPDLVPTLEALLQPVARHLFDRLSSRPHDTGVIAVARKPAFDPAALFAMPRCAPLIVLDAPRHLGNVGAVIRVAAAAGAGGVLTAGPLDPWHAHALRGAAGLHFALPVGRIACLPQVARPIYAIDPAGEPLAPAALPPDAVLIFGSERRGIGDAMLARADRQFAIPMAPGISSLNLATAVAVVLYAWRLAPRRDKITDHRR